MIKLSGCTLLGFTKPLATALLILLGTYSPLGWAAAEFQAVDVVEFFGETMDGEPIPSDPDFTGAAWLNRTESRIQGRIMTKVDRFGRPYTVWVVIFNNPEACMGPCNGPDLGLEAVKPSVYYGSGAISAWSPPGGVVNIDLALTDEGLADGRFRLDDAFPEPFPFWVDGLTEDNGLCAEIHLVVDEHLTPRRPWRGNESWVADLTSTIFPGTELPPGISASNHRAAIFPPAEACSAD